MIRSVPGSTVTSGLRSYRELLGVPAVARVVSWGLLARMPIGMVALALILLVRGHGGSYGDAGVVSASEAIAAAAGAPIAGRLVDRGRPSVILVGYGLVFAACMVALVVLTAARAPLIALAGAAALSGAALPPIGPTVRMLWPSMVENDGQLRTAFALEATLQELIFVSGPLLVGLCTGLIDSSAGVLASGVLCLAGILGFVRSDRVRGHGAAGHPERRHLLAALRPPTVRRIVVFSAGYGFAFGAVEVALPAFAETHGGRSLGALALAAWSGGSLTGGLVAGAHRPADPRSRLRLISCMFALGLLLPLVARSLPEMAAIMFLVGTPIAPSFALTYAMVQQAAEPGTHAEVFGWLSTATVVGVAAGTAIGGHLITVSGPSASLAIAVGGAAFAAAVATFFRGARRSAPG
jgi:MFS family permease